MPIDRTALERALAALPERTLESAIFNIAHAYARASDLAWKSISDAKDADFAGPAVMCQSFAVELLLTYFLVTDHPSARTVTALEQSGVKLRCHKYSELFDQLLPATKAKLAASYASLTGQPAGVPEFQAALIAQGDDPFVAWRYVYESNGVSHFDREAFNSVTDALGNAAANERKRQAGQKQK